MTNESAVLLRPREAVLEMAPYSPPSSGRAGKLRLDFNENTQGCSPQVIRFLQSALSPDGLAVYPEYNQTKPRLASFFGVAPDHLLLTNGTDEAIQVLINTYVDDRDEVIVLHPSYAMYRFYAEVAGAQLQEIPYRSNDLSFPLEELIDAVTPSTRAILLANPNNPTGTAITVEQIELILLEAANAAVLIDEAYFEFSSITVLPLIEKHPNLFVSRTFSKVYGLAALRMGCLFSAPGNIAYLHKAQSPYSVNAVAAAAACAAIEDQEYIRHYVGEVLIAREELYGFLESLGIPYYRSQGNFVLMRFGDRSIEVRDKLRDRGLLVRDRSYEIAGCVRVTVGTREQMALFSSALREIW
jgi:histidinol-phosphate aminotransferase